MRLPFVFQLLDGVEEVLKLSPVALVDDVDDLLCSIVHDNLYTSHKHLHSRLFREQPRPTSPNLSLISLNWRTRRREVRVLTIGSDRNFFVSRIPQKQQSLEAYYTESASHVRK